MLRVCCSIPGLCGLALCLWLGAGPSAAAFETLNRIRAEGALRVAVLDGQPTADRMALEQLAEHLSVHLTPIIAEDHDALFKLLASGEVDLVGDPVSARRPLPQGLGLSRPVRHADLWLVRGASAGSPSTLAVRYASDAWYQGLESRGQLDGLALRVAPGGDSTLDLMRRTARGEFGATLVYDAEMDIAGNVPGLKPERRMQADVALGWVLRQDDRVLAHRVNRFLETWGLTRDVSFVDRGDYDQIVERGRLRLVTVYRPQTYFAWSGQLMGLDYELAAAFARRHGLALDVILARDPADLQGILSRGEADVGAALLRRDELTAGLAATQPYFTATGVLVARSGRFHRLRPLDLHGKRVAVSPSSPYLAALAAWQEAGIGIETVRVDSEDALIESVLQGRAELAAVDRFRYRLEATWRPEISAAMELPIEVPRVWAVRAENPNLALRLNAFWAESEGTLAFNLKINKYLGRSESSAAFRAASIAFARDRAISPYDDLVRRYAAYYDFDWRLILAVIFQESRFDPEAVSVSGARGLMQVKPVSARQVGIDGLLEPRQGIHAGVRYLGWLRDRFESDLDVRDRLWLALAAYNGGLTHIRAARAEAERLGLDSRRWFGQVEQALVSLSSRPEYAGLDVKQITRYVAQISERYRSYVHLSQGAGPEPHARQVASATAAPRSGTLSPR